MNVLCVVQARMTSTRLPGKVMLPLGGKPVIWHVLCRARRIPGVGLVACAVPEGSDSDPIRAECDRLGVPVVVGPEKDVLSRYAMAAAAFGAHVVMRITSDCPLIDPAICGQVLRFVTHGGADYASNVCPRGFAKGLDCEAFTADALSRAHASARDDYDREHVTPWMQRNGTFIRANLAGDLDAEVRWTLDTAEDYAFLQAVFERHGDDWRVVH